MDISKSLQLVTDTLWQIQTKKECTLCLDELLTASEISGIAERILIFKMLKDGKTQREIATTLGVSITTVTRGNKIFRSSANTIQQFI